MLARSPLYLAWIAAANLIRNRDPAIILHGGAVAINLEEQDAECVPPELGLLLPRGFALFVEFEASRVSFWTPNSKR